MKKVRCYIAVLVSLGVFALCGSAHATIFTVSDITFSALSDTELLKWTITPVSSPFVINGGDIAAGGPSVPITLGQLVIDEFAVDTDSFNVSFKITPPNISPLSDIGAIVSTTSGGNKVAVDFVNTSGEIINFGYNNTGAYKVTFNKINKTTSLTIPLTADFHYTTAPTGNGDTGTNLVPVPEPSTMVLLGSGLLGLIFVGRSRRRK